FDSKHLLDNRRLMTTFRMFHIQSVIPEFLHRDDGMLKIWENLHWVLFLTRRTRTFKNCTGLSSPLLCRITSCAETGMEVASLPLSFVFPPSIRSSQRPALSDSV